VQPNLVSSSGSRCRFNKCPPLGLGQDFEFRKGIFAQSTIDMVFPMLSGMWRQRLITGPFRSSRESFHDSDITFCHPSIRKQFGIRTHASSTLDS